MSRLFGLIKLYSKYLILVPLFLLAVAMSTYVTERAVNRYYVGRDLRLLAAAAEQIEADYESRARVERNRPGSTVSSAACKGRVSTGYDSKRESERKRPPDLSQNLSDHVRPLIQRNLFSLVIVAKENGTVLAQEPSSGPRFTDLSALLRPVNLQARTSTDQPFVDFSIFAKATNVREIEFAGQDYWAFAQPFRAYRKEWTPEPEHFVLVGLLPSRSLWSAPLDFTRRSWVVALLGTLAAFAFWPMLKLWFAKPGTDLRAFEVFRFVYSLVALASIATFAVLYLAFQHQRELNIDYRLDRLAREVREEASKELAEAVSQLDLFDQEAKLNQGWAEHQDQPGRRYEAYDAATWIDENGCQLIQYVRDRIGYAQNLSDRQYFQQVRDNNVWTVKFEGGDAKVGANEKKLVIESVRSRATALPAAALAMKSENKLAKPAPVAVMTIPFESIMRPVLPEDYGFALVDENGKVHFHSDPSRGAGENILIETANDSLLYSSLVRRTEKTFSVQYQGAPHRVHVTRFLVGTPWSLVVFHDLSQGRRLQLETLLNALVLFLVSAGCIMAFTALAYRARYVIRKEKWGTWRSVAEDWAEDWLKAFHTRSTEMNVALAVTYLCCLALLLLAAYRLESAYLLSFALAVQIAATVIAWVPADNPPGPGNQREPKEDSPKKLFPSVERMIPTVTLLGLAVLTVLAGTVSGQHSVFVLFAAAFVAMGVFIARIMPQKTPDRKPSILARYSYMLPATLLCVLTGMASCFIVMVTAARHSEYAELRTSQLAFAYALDRMPPFSDWTARHGIYDEAILGAKLQPVLSKTGGTDPFYCEPRNRDDAGGWTDLWGLITDLQLASARNLQSSMDLHNDATHDGSWGWCTPTTQERHSARSGNDSVTFQRLYTHIRTVAGKQAFGFQIKSVMPGKLTLQPRSPNQKKANPEGGDNGGAPLRYWIALATIGGLLPWLLHGLLCRCLMIHVKPTCLTDHLRTDPQIEPGENTILLLPAFVRGPTLSRKAAHRVDLKCFSSAAQLRRHARDFATHDGILFENFQSLLPNDEMAAAMLDCLEDLTIDGRRTIVVLSTVHPVQFLTTNSLEGAFGEPRYPAEYVGRWQALTERFVTEQYGGEHASADANGWRAWLDCSKREQDVLRDISWNSLAHPRDMSIVRELMRRKLVQRDSVSQLLAVEKRVDRYAEESPIPVSASARDPVITERGFGLGQVIGSVLVLVPLALFAFEQDLATKLAGLLGAVVGLPVGLNRWLSSESVREKKTTEVS